MPSASHIDLNDEFKKALALFEESSDPILLTGKAGTGKSTLLKYFIENTPHNVAVLAPTGIAALNIKGQTIHSFFEFKPSITVEKAKKIAKRLRIQHGKDSVYHHVKILVVDEISMVRADLFDCMDEFLKIMLGKKELPFGGMKLILVGDLYQLPPVLRQTEKEHFAQLYPSPYFFHSHVYPTLKLKTVELTHVYRQSDSDFVNFLNKVRNNSITPNDIEWFNKRCFQSGHKIEKNKSNNLAITLAATNAQANEINQLHLEKLSGKPHTFNAEVSGDFGTESFPTETELKLKKEAQVMLLNNDAERRWVNGSMAKITALTDKQITITLENGEIEEVEPVTWEIFSYDFDKTKNKLITKPQGTFKQYPIRLAWAVTIHKSQGKTFEQVTIDVGRGTFATGQMYVALSRCRTLEGLRIKKPLKKSDIFVDWKILKFLTGEQYEKSEKLLPLAEKIKMLEAAITERAIIEMTYLKARDEKLQRKIRPIEVGEMFYNGLPFLGVKGQCQLRKEDRTFRIDRILEMKMI